MKNNKHCEQCDAVIENEYEYYENLTVDLRAFFDHKYQNQKYSYHLSKIDVLIENNSDILESAINYGEKYIEIEQGNYIFRHKLLKDNKIYTLIHTDPIEEDLNNLVNDIGEILEDKKEYEDEIENLNDIVNEEDDIKELFQKIMFLIKLKNMNSKLIEDLLKNKNNFYC